jgi:hypothetical protein
MIDHSTCASEQLVKVYGLMTWAICMQPADDVSRFRVEVQFSNGANYDPRITKVMNDKPREMVQRGDWIALSEFQDHMRPWGSPRKATATPATMLRCMGPAVGSNPSM